MVLIDYYKHLAWRNQMTEREHMLYYESEKEREKREKQEVKKIGRNIAKKIIRNAKKASGL